MVADTMMLPVVLAVALSNVSFGYQRTIFSRAILSGSLVTAEEEAVVVEGISVCARLCANSKSCGSFAFSSWNEKCYTFNRFVSSSEASTEVIGTSAYLKHHWRPNGYSYVDGTDCYLKNGQKVTYTQARSICNYDGAALLDLQTSRKRSLVRDYLKEKGVVGRSYWLGGSDEQKEGVWRWSDGSLVTHIIWCPTEPNNIGGENHMMITNSFTCINDEAEWRSNYYICELSAVAVP